MLSLGQLIIAGLLKFVWIIIIQGPLLIISYVADAIKYLTQGILWNIFFDTNGVYKNGVITPPNMNDVKIPWIFIGFIIIAIFVGFLVFLWQLLKVIITRTKDTKLQRQGVLNAIKFFALSFLVTFTIPALFFVLIAIMGFLSEAINLAFQGSTKQGGIAEFLYLLGAPSWFNGPIPSNFAPPSDSAILNYNMLVQWIGTWFALFALLIVSWIIMLKTAELFFLFIISPFLAFTMPLDDGKRVVLWKNMVISKTLVILGNLVMYYVYVILISLIHSSIGASNWFTSSNGGDIARAIVELAFIAGASMAVFSASSIIASFVGESFGMREGMDTFRGFVGLMGTSGAMGLMAKGVKLPFKLGKKGVNAGKKVNLSNQKMMAKLQQRKHNKIDQEMSYGQISEREGAIKHAMVGQHFWRKKQLKDMQKKEQFLNDIFGFNNKHEYFNHKDKEAI